MVEGPPTTNNSPNTKGSWRGVDGKHKPGVLRRTRTRINNQPYSRKQLDGRKNSKTKKQKCTSCDVENFSNLLGMKSISDEVNEELSKSKTKLFGEMFLTLTEPPSFFERLYNKTIYGPQSRLIMLASNIVNKSPENFKLKAKKIYSKIASIIFKKYHNESFENRTDIPFFKGKFNKI